MSNVREFLTSLGLEVKTEGSQLRVDCQECDDTKMHLYIEQGNGLGYCHKCGWSPNPYKLIEKITSKTPAEIMKMLDEHGLNDSNHGQSAVSNQRSAISEEKKVPTAHGNKMMLSKEDVLPLTKQERTDFCQLKQIDEAAFEKFRPYAHAKEPWVLIPVFSPDAP
ncbi:MAG: hypothetical protein FVQ79_13815, partial [Planctomycetes bacterium]|nr:hypothetical protein [Planctomycetota bacterium]